LLYLHSDRDYSLAEAGKAIGASPKVMSTEADRLVTAGLVRETRRDQARLLRAETRPGRPDISVNPALSSMTSTFLLLALRMKMISTTLHAKLRSVWAER
jgi:hypothetical protein